MKNIESTNVDNYSAGATGLSESHNVELNPTQKKNDPLDEVFDEAQSGDFVMVGLFEPRLLANYYLGDRENSPKLMDAEKIEELVDKLVDRILITGSTDMQGQELQLKLVNSVLHGAELWIRRERGELQISFQAKTIKSKTLIEEHSHELSTSLSDKLNEVVKISVEIAGETL